MAPGPLGPGGCGAMGPGATGPGPMGPGAVGPGAVGPGAVGPGAVGPGGPAWVRRGDRGRFGPRSIVSLSIPPLHPQNVMILYLQLWGWLNPPDSDGVKPQLLMAKR